MPKDVIVRDCRGRIAAAILTPKQAEFVKHLVAKGVGQGEAARLAGYAEPSAAAWALMQKPHIIAAIKQERDHLIQGDLANLAAGVVRDVLKSATASEKVKADLAVKVLHMAGHAPAKADKAQDPANESDLHAMSLEQLEAFVEQQRHLAAERAHPVIEGTATHDDGAKGADDDSQAIDSIEDAPV